MEEKYHLKKKKISELLDVLDSFEDRMSQFNEKFNNKYTYGIDVYQEDDEDSNGAIFVADINITHDD